MPWYLGIPLAVITLLYIIEEAGGVGYFLLEMVSVGVLIVVVLLILAGGWEAMLKPGREEKERKAVDSELDTATLFLCKDVISRHQIELATKRRKLIVSRGYGILDTKRWEKEKVFFIANVLTPSCPSATDLAPDRLSELIDATLDRFDQHR